MRVLLFHCKTVKVAEKWREHTWLNPLLALACFEKKDDTKGFDKMLGEITRSLEYLKVKTVVLVPFERLSPGAIAAEDNRRRIDRLQKKLERAGYNASQFEFEKVQDVELDLIGHRVSVGFRGD